MGIISRFVSQTHERRIAILIAVALPFLVSVPLNLSNATPPTVGLPSGASDAAEYLRAHGYNLTSNPQFASTSKAVTDKIQSMTEALRLEAEKHTPVETLVIRSVQPELLVFNRGGKTVVAVSEGLLGRIQTDGQLAFLIAQGMSYPIDKTAESLSHFVSDRSVDGVGVIAEKRIPLAARVLALRDDKIEEIFTRVRDGGWSPAAYRNIESVLTEPGSPKMADMFDRGFDQKVKKFDLVLNHQKFAGGHVGFADDKVEITRLAQDKWLKTAEYKKALFPDAEKALAEFSKSDFDGFLKHVASGSNTRTQESFEKVLQKRVTTVQALIGKELSETERLAWLARINLGAMNDLGAAMRDFHAQHPTLTVQQLSQLNGLAAEATHGSAVSREVLDVYEKQTDDLAERLRMVDIVKEARPGEDREYQQGRLDKLDKKIADREASLAAYRRHYGQDPAALQALATLDRLQKEAVEASRVSFFARVDKKIEMDQQLRALAGSEPGVAGAVATVERVELAAIRSNGSALVQGMSAVSKGYEFRDPNEMSAALIRRLPAAEQDAAFLKAFSIRKAELEKLLKAQTSLDERKRVMNFVLSDQSFRWLFRDNFPSDKVRLEFFKGMMKTATDTIAAIDGKEKAANWYREEVRNLFLVIYHGHREPYIPVEFGKKIFPAFAESYFELSQQALKTNLSNKYPASHAMHELSELEARALPLPPDLQAKAEAYKKRALEVAFEARAKEFKAAGLNYTIDHRNAELRLAHPQFVRFFPEAATADASKLWKATQELAGASTKEVGFYPHLDRLTSEFAGKVDSAKIAATFGTGEASYRFNEETANVPAVVKLKNEISEYRAANKTLPTNLEDLFDGWTSGSEASRRRMGEAAKKKIIELGQQLNAEYPGDFKMIASKLFEARGWGRLESKQRLELTRLLMRNGIIPRKPADQLQFVLGLKNRTDGPFGIASAIIGYDKGHVDFSKFRTDELIEVYNDVIKWNDPSDFKDQFYRYLKAEVQKKPALQAQFRPNVRMILDRNLRREAMLDELRAELPELGDLSKKAAPVAKPDNAFKIRPQIRSAAMLIEHQLDESDPLRNELIEVVQDRFQTNVNESERLSRGAVDLGKIEAGHGRSAMINADQFDHTVKTPEDNFKILTYLLGDKKEEYPAFIKEITDLKSRRKAIERLNDAFVQFHSGTPEGKALLLQPMFGSKNGLLTTPEMKAKVEALILGKYKETKVVSRIFQSYLNNTKPEDRNITYGRFIASLTDKETTVAREGGAPVRSLGLNQVLDSMYAFGDRVKQGLAVSPWLSPELRAETSVAFTNSHPPTRQEIFDNLAVLLGENASSIKDAQLVGSGSVNFVVRAKIKDPATGELREVVIRMQKAKARGQIQNQDDVWKAVAEDLAHDKDPEIRRAANNVAEVREYAMTSLGKGGTDLRQSHERASYGRAAEIYKSPGGVADAKTGFKIEVTKPIDSLQTAYVPNEYRDFVSFYEYVPNVPLTDVEPKLRRELANQILNTELRAVFDHGEFDPEPHPGNWLIDTQGKRVVRTDYASFMKIPDADRLALRDVFASLLQPKLSSADLDRLAKSLPQLFENKELAGNGIREVLDLATAGKGFPAFTDPSERLIFIRSALETRAEKVTGKVQSLKFNFNAQSAFSSLQKTSQYRAYLSPSQIANAFLGTLEVSKTKMAGSLLRAAAACATDFSKVGGKGKP